jgi:hypothetical protein
VLAQYCRGTAQQASWEPVALLQERLWLHACGTPPHPSQALNNNTEAGTVLQPGQRVFLPPFNKDACGSGTCTWHPDLAG